MKNNASSSNKANAGCLWFFVAFVLAIIAMFSDDPQICWILTGIIFFIAIIVFSVESRANTHPESNRSYLIDEARSALDNATDETLRRILECFINSSELVEKINEERRIIKNLNEKPIDNHFTIAEHEEIVEQLREKLDKIQYDVDSELSPKQLETFGSLSKAFESLKGCDKVWRITEEIQNTGSKSSATSSVVRNDGRVFSGVFNYLKSKFNIPAFEVGNSKLYLYPKFVILAEGPARFQYIPYNALTISSTLQKFQEEDEIPSDCERTGNTWKYVNKNGGPDRRYADNRRIAVVVYGALNIDYNGTKYLFHFSNYPKTRNFAKAVASHKEALGFSTDESDGDKIEKILNRTDDLISQTRQLNAKTDYIKMLPLAKEAARKLYEHLCLMNKNEGIIRILSKKVNLRDTSNSNKDLSGDRVENRFYPNLDNHLSLMAVNDVQKCFERLGHGSDIRELQALPVAIFFTYMIDPDTDLWDYSDIQPYEIAEGAYNVAKENFNPQFDEDKFILFELLRDTEADQELVNKYIVLLYRFAMIIANADNTIDETEKKWLSHILSFSNDSKKPQESTHPKQTVSQRGLKIAGDALKELTGLIGLESVKSEVENIYNLIKIQKVREEKGLKSSKISYHCVFTGNPGTGKTTVARLVAQIYKDLGILSKGHLVETDRSGLVAEYVGQTAVKTNKIIDSALDGVLFIDEAYSLVQGSQNDFGMEAIATLLKRMEDNRDRLVVILAGYSDEMKQFIEANPGLQSRFNRYIHFEDYNADDLVAIYGFNLKKYDYQLSEDGMIKLREVLTAAVANKDKNFGNARYIRNLFEKTLENQARRLASVSDLSEDVLTEIRGEDIPDSL